ncbi:MAG: hypothetical protein RLZZ59_716, partial [Pseudomonadota bacterium]
MRLIKNYISIIFLLLVPSFVFACCEDSKQSLSKVVEEFAGKHKHLHAVYAINNGDKSLLNGAMGFFDVKTKKKLSTSQQMPIASGTKPMTAAAILLLQDRGMLNVHDTVALHFPADCGLWDESRLPHWANKTTIHHLLTHSSGLQDYVFSYYTDIKKTPEEIRKDIINKMSKLPLEFNPGSRAAYSNTGYLLLGMIVEKVSSKKLDEFLRDELFKPNGMNETKLVSFKEAVEYQQGKNHTYPVRYYVTPNGENPEFDPVGAQIIFAPNADGGVVSTVSDLIKWNLALHNGKILSANSYKQMTKSYYKTLPSGGYPTHIGYGMYISKMKNGDEIYHHEGRALGIRSDNGYIPNKKIHYAI